METMNIKCINGKWSTFAHLFCIKSAFKSLVVSNSTKLLLGKKFIDCTKFAKYYLVSNHWFQMYEIHNAGLCITESVRSLQDACRRNSVGSCGDLPGLQDLESDYMDSIYELSPETALASKSLKSKILYRFNSLNCLGHVWQNSITTS